MHSVKGTVSDMERTYPLSPRSSRDLRIGDYWTVPLSDGTFGCLQVTELQQSGPGSLKTLVAGVVDWRDAMPPSQSDLVGRRVLEQGLTRIEAFTEVGSRVIGNTITSTGGVRSPRLLSESFGRGVLVVEQCGP